MKSVSVSKSGVPASAITLSSVRKLVQKVRTISKDISVRRRSVDYHRSRIQYHEELISKSLEDLHNRTESIVQKMEISGNPVRVPIIEVGSPETNLPRSGSPLSEMGLPPSSELSTLGVMPSPDIRCYETVWDLPDLWNDPTFPSNGTMDIPEWESQDSPMNDFLEHLLRSP